MACEICYIYIHTNIFIDLGNDKLRDVEELREAVQRQIGAQRAVDVLRPRGIHRHDLARGVLCHQSCRAHDS